MKQSFPTLSAALKARAWARARRAKTGHWPDIEERVMWIAKMFKEEIDVAYVNRACEAQQQEVARG